MSGSSMASRPAVSKMTTSRLVSLACAHGRLADLGRRRALEVENTGTSSFCAEDLGAARWRPGGRCRRRRAAGGACCFSQVAGELADGGRLTGALQADHHDAGRALLRPVEVGVDRAHQLDELVLADLDEVLLGRGGERAVADLGAQLDDGLAERLLLDAVEEGLDDLELDVGLEQRHAHVAQRLFDVVLGELGDAGEARLRVPKALG